MKHFTSQSDQAFLTQVESCEYQITEFNHRAHLRLAYIYLAEHDVDTAYVLTRKSILNLLKHNRIELDKFHVTITRAWILAVRYFLETVRISNSSNEFIDSMPEMLDSKIMMTHYSEGKLFSDQARKEFVQPDLDPIPRYGD